MFFRPVRSFYIATFATNQLAWILAALAAVNFCVLCFMWVRSRRAVSTWKLLFWSFVLLTLPGLGVLFYGGFFGGGPPVQAPEERADVNRASLFWD